MLILTTPATSEPIPVDQARSHLRLGHQHQDALIQTLISAAREAVELETGRALAAASYAWTPESDCASAQFVPIRPATITSADGVIPVEFTTVPGAAPPSIVAAMLLIISDLYEHPDATIVGQSVEINPAVSRLLYPHRLTVGI